MLVKTSCMFFAPSIRSRGKNLKSWCFDAENFILLYLAEQAGFEPAVGYEPTHAFQACDLNHSSTAPCSPRFYTGKSGLRAGVQLGLAVLIICIAEPMSELTSVMLPGTMSVVVASEASLA